MILFVGGGREEGYFAEEAAEKWNYKFNYVESGYKIKEQVNKILAYQSCEFMIFEINHFIDDMQVIVDEIDKISKVNNAKPIIYAVGIMPDADIIKALLKKEIKNFIFGTTKRDMIDQLEKCINGYYEVNDMETLMHIEKEIEEEEEKEKRDFKMIGVSWVCDRIGTTTQALQLVKYFILKGYQACYIEMNDTGFVDEITKWYCAVKIDENIGKVTFGNVDMFRDPEKLPEILRMDYDYYIYDYGTYNHTNFNKTSFLEKNIRIFVAGSHPSEMKYTLNLLQNTFYDDAFYLFNFAGENERQDLLDEMDEKADHTFFLLRMYRIRLY